jgi:hypothetical protein
MALKQLLVRRSLTAVIESYIARLSPADHYNSHGERLVEIFERHGFIWGGNWSHFDTMHFEYRPELLNPR